MSAADCIEEIKRAAGRDLSDDQLDDLLTELERRKRQRQAERTGEAGTDQVLAAADDLASDLEMAAIVEKRNRALNLLRRMESEDYVRSNFDTDRALGLEALITGVNRNRSGSRRSAAAEQHQLANYYRRGFIADVERAGLWRIFISGELDREISRAASHLGDPEATGRGPDVSPEARQLAEIMHKWQEAARADANRAGAWIRRRPGYIVRQSHDMFKIRRVSFEEWRDFIAPRLAERTFEGVGDRDGFLRSVYEALASGVHLTATAGDGPSGLTGFRNIARRMSQDRVLHFKTADDWFDYNVDFGSGSLRESLLFGFGRMAEQTGLMRVWGPNARQNYDAVFRQLLSETRDPQARAKLQADRAWLDNRFAEVDGSVNIPGNMMVARWSAIIRAIESMAKLGGAVLSAIADIPIAASELRFQGVGFLESHAVPLRALVQGRATREQREILGMIGVANQGLYGGVIHRFSAHDDLPGVFSRLMRTFFKFNGLTWWTDRVREGVALSMANRLAFNRNRSWASLDDDLRRSLGQFGIDAPQWDLIRRRSTRMADGEDFIVPEAAREIPDDEIRAVIGGDTSDAAVRRFRQDLESGLRSWVVDRAEFAVIEADARTRAILRRGTRPGTVEGEFFRFIGQFKAFPVAAVTKAGGRELFGRGADTVGEALRNGNGEMVGLGNLIWTTTAAGYVAQAAKDLSRGRTPRDPNDPRTWFAAMAQGGGAGIYGDFLFGEARNRFGGTALSTALGPTAGTVEDLFDIYGRLREGEDAAAQTFSTIVNTTPFLNLFYARFAFDYLLGFQVREALNPGFLRRSERRIERENAQQFIVPPSSVIPRGGGDRLFEGVR